MSGERLTDRCSVHGDRLVDGYARAIDVGNALVDPIELDGTLAGEAYPNAHFSKIVRTPTGTVSVRFCPSCRLAARAWRDAPGSLEAKEALRHLGYDPFRGTPVPMIRATLVTDYVWCEKWVRAMRGLRYLPYVTPSTRAISLPATDEELVGQIVRLARLERAPLDATRPLKPAGWERAEEIQIEAVRIALGLQPH